MGESLLAAETAGKALTYGGNLYCDTRSHLGHNVPFPSRGHAYHRQFIFCFHYLQTHACTQARSTRRTGSRTVHAHAHA